MRYFEFFLETPPAHSGAGGPDVACTLFLHALIHDECTYVCCWRVDGAKLEDVNEYKAAIIGKVLQRFTG